MSMFSHFHEMINIIPLHKNVQIVSYGSKCGNTCV